MKTVTKQLMEQIINKLNVSVKRLSSNKLQLAHDLHWSHNVIQWSLTDYGSWKGFCEEHVKLDVNTIYQYIMVIENINKFGYTDEECDQMLDAMSWKNFRLALADMNRKLILKTFVTRYKNFTSHIPSRNAKERRKGSDRAYTFSLPEEEADLLDMHLVNYGMLIGPYGRRGVRDAMIELVNRKLK